MKKSAMAIAISAALLGAQLIGNPNAPFVNQYAQQANLAANYFAIGHPSLTNYLEVHGARATMRSWSCGTRTTSA